MWSTERKGPLVVCIVESSPAVCSILRLSLREPEFLLRFFSDIPALHESISQERPDVLLMNISFRQGITGSIPFVLLAGAFDVLPPSLPEPPTCRAFVRVPFDSGELARLVRSIGREGNHGPGGTTEIKPSDNIIPAPPDLERRVRRIVQEELQKRDKEYGIPEEPE
ncbi:MAG: response regulator [Acidobacteria bacterium]|nr:response regulator [Acidobacteriota bacterium]